MHSIITLFYGISIFRNNWYAFNNTQIKPYILYEILFIIMCSLIPSIILLVYINSVKISTLTAIYMTHVITGSVTLCIIQLQSLIHIINIMAYDEPPYVMSKPMSILSTIMFGLTLVFTNNICILSIVSILLFIIPWIYNYINKYRRYLPLPFSPGTVPVQTNTIGHNERWIFRVTHEPDDVSITMTDNPVILR